MGTNSDRAFLTGFRKVAVYARIALHVALRYGGRVAALELGPFEYVRFLRRALIFLLAMRHGKVVRKGGEYRLHIYVPAYPTPAFFHLLDKLLSDEPGPGNVVFSMTRACRYECPHCYQRRDAGTDLDSDLMIQVAREMQDIGVSLFDIEGGEPLLRADKLMALLGALDERSELWVNTTGDRLTPEMARELVAAGLKGVMVSIHSPDDKAHDEFTGVPGSFRTARAALRIFREAGVYTAINCCPSAEAVLLGDLDRIMELARELGCAYVQAIQEKAAGAWLGRGYPGWEGDAAIRKLGAMHLKYNGGGAFKEYPSLSAQVFEESAELFGCTAGGVDRFYLGADGEVQPCEFLNVSFGNVREEAFPDIYRRMRKAFPEPCSDWLCYTQAQAIREAVEENGLERTPVPWRITKGLVESWNRGRPTALYRRIGIYRK